ncbi:MAG: exodeoxyribonuclease V subunit gamma [Pseudoxanthomonas sp.]
MPAPSSDFRLYHSNSLEVLAGLLATELREPAPGQPLLAPDTVLIPQVAMRRWLQATLAAAHGIAANLEFLTPGEFVQRALDANVPGVADDLGVDALRWQLYAALTDPLVLREAAMQPLKRYLDGDNALKPWSLAGELASVFEKYQAWRRDWLLGWEAGQAPRDPQAVLWRHIASGRAHRARRIDNYLADYANDARGGDAPLPMGLPSRLFAFATLNVSPDVLRVIATQARVGTLHFYMPTPTRSYWGDLQTLGERLPAQIDDPFATVDADNPLLQAWGAAGRDFVAVLGSYEVVHPSGEIAAYADPETRVDDNSDSDSLLQRLQRDLLHRRPPPATPWREQVDLHDSSLQVHACHTRLREVQVLHDQLRGLLEDPRFDPPLQPREIAVLAPDIDPYAPYIEAVFGGLSGTTDFIPYALADTSPLASEPLAEVFLHLLGLPISRFGLNEILDLLACAPIANAAGLDAPALERLRGWLSAAGARWGIDGGHRERHQAPRDDAYTWAFALDRLLLGHASGDEGEIAGVAPWPELEGSGLAALDALIRLLRVLARNERVLGEAMTPAQWRERLLGLLEAILPKPPQALADQRALERLRNSIDGFAEAARRAGFDQPVPPEVLRAHFAAELAEADTRAPLLTGGVSFGRMVPMRLLPFRVLCVLGMNDGDYPRRDPAAGLNQLTAELGTKKRRHGDRSLREDDRYLFLQLFSAASEVFYLSYLGADPRDGSAREPSMLVSELIEVAANYHADVVEAGQQLVVHHPLQPFAAAAFGADDGKEEGKTEPRRFSYRREWHPAADASHAQRKPPARWLVDPLPAAEVVESLSLAELRGFLRDPADAFLRQSLALRLPQVGDAGDDLDPLAAPGSGLDRWKLQQAVFAACVSGREDDTSALHRQLRARALLPSGPLGERQLKLLRAQMQPYADAFVQWRGGRTVESQAFELDLDGVRLHGRIEDIYATGLPRFRYDKLHGPSQITHGLDWLVMSALGNGPTLFQFYDTGEGVGPVARDPADPQVARVALRALLRLRAQGLREPLPFGPRAGWLWYDGQRRLDAGQVPRANNKTPWERARDQWHAERGWSEGDTASARLALRGRDPFADDEFGEALGEEFRAIAGIVFDAVVQGREGEGA